MRPLRSQVQSDPIAETPVKSCCVVLETVSRDQLEKISQYSESSAGWSERNEVSDGENSGSGDSLFITQADVPEDVTLSEDPVNEDNISLITDDGGREKKGEKYRLPKFSFTFLSEKRQRSTELSAQQNRKLHYALMGGYFKCIRELWESYRRGEDLVASQPTIDTVGVHIAPISEGEEEGLEDKDMKVVEKKHFVVPSKAKCSKPWCSPEETVVVVRQQTRSSSVAGFESQRRQRTRVDKDSTQQSCLKVAMSADRKHSNDGNSSDADLEEEETGNKCVTSDEDVQHELQNQGRSLKHARRKFFDQNENDEELCSSSSAAVYESSPTKSVKTGKKRSAAASQPPSYVGFGEREADSQNFLQRDDDTLCSEATVKKRKKKKRDKHSHEGVEEEKDPSQEGVKGQHAEASVSVGSTEVEEAPSLLQVINEPDPPESKGKKKKRKRKKSVTEDVRQDVDGHVDGRVEEDSVLNKEDGDKNKKKKRKRNSDHMDLEDLNTSTLVGHCEMLKKSRKKDINETSDIPQISAERCKETEDRSETTSVSQEMLEFKHVHRKKHKKKKKRSAYNDDHVGEGSCADVDFNNDATNLSGSAGLSVKKKKKHISEASCVPEEDENAQKTTETLEEQDAEMVTQKKKKKKKKEKLSTNLAEDTETQTDHSVSARKKEKKTSSFLVADDEGKAAQTRGEKHSHLQFVAARDSYAEKPDLSEGHLTAKVPGSLQRPEKKKKKKKKRSAAEENVERETEFVEPEKAGQKVSSETDIRKKKKHKRNKSELISTERSESSAQADEDAVLRKKKKKSKEAIPPAATEAPEIEQSTPSVCASHSPEKKAENGHSSKIYHVSSFCNGQETRETPVPSSSPSLSSLGNKLLGDEKKKQKKEKAANRVLKVKSSIGSAEVETPKVKKERKEPTADGRVLSITSLSQPETLSSNSIRKNKHMKGKRRLLNPNEDFL